MATQAILVLMPALDKCKQTALNNYLICTILGLFLEQRSTLHLCPPLVYSLYALWATSHAPFFLKNISDYEAISLNP